MIENKEHCSKPVKLFLFAMLIWLCALGFIITKDTESHLISILNRCFQLIIHLIILYYVVRFYNRVDQTDKKFARWLLIIALFFFLNDFSYFYFIDIVPMFQFFGSPEITTTKRVINNLFSIIWLLSTIIFLWQIIRTYIVSKKTLLSLLGLLLTINLITIALYLLPISEYADIFSAHSLFLECSILIESIIFDLAIISLIYIKDKGAQLIISGLILIIAGDFFIAYRWIVSKPIIDNDYTGLVWSLGMIFIMQGFILNSDANTNKMAEWFNNGRSIKNKITLGTFIVSYLCYIALYVLASMFSFINKEAFIWMPLISMLYSVIVVLFSLQVGKMFETPFIKIKENINTVLTDSSTKIDLIDYKIEEFDKLQEFLIHAIQLKENEDKLKKQFGDIAASAAHDIASPINAIEMILAKIKNGEQLNDNVTSILQIGLQSLRDISSKLIRKYRSINKTTGNHMVQDDTNIARYILINKYINTLIQSKVMEWQHNQVQLHFSPELNDVWLLISPLEISRVLSNLINNAYESLINQSSVIKLSSAMQNENFIITIEDNGCGIAADKLHNISNGLSSKHDGSGVGIISALKYIDSINGKLSFESIIDVGTKVLISIPIPPQPSWVVNKINYNESSTFIVLDNDVAIIKNWLSIFTRLNIKFHAFVNYAGFSEWYLNNQHNENEIFLIDYDLDIDELTGLDIIKTHQLTNAYLVTNHAEEYWLQEKTTMSSISLIPKHQIHHLLTSIHSNR